MDQFHLFTMVDEFFVVIVDVSHSIEIICRRSNTSRSMTLFRYLRCASISTQSFAINRFAIRGHLH